MLNLAILPAALLAAAAGESPALERITVTAARAPQSIADSLVTVEVIERQDIVRSQARDLVDLLRSRSGIDLARTGGAGQQTSVFLRGSNSNHVLVLIDGVRVASSNTGAYTFEQLPLVHVDRIEIVRGPRAALYGSDAIGGVIQIHTRRAAGTHALLSYGTDADAEVAVGQGFTSADGASSLHLGLSRRDYGGFSAQNPDGFGYDPDDDGSESTRLNLHAGHAFNEDLRVGLSLLGVNLDVDFDQGESAMDDRSVGVALEHRISTDWEHRVQLGYARQHLSTPVYDQRFETERRQLDWLHQVQLGDGRQLGFGLNLLREEGLNGGLSGFLAYAGERDSEGAFLRYGQQFSVLDLELSGRYDHYDGFGSELTGQLALGHAFEGGRVYASYGEGFRAPNLNELYSPGFGGLFAGNPLLDPERSRQFELGARLAVGAGVLEAQLYRSRVRDLIAFQGGQTFQAINIARAEIDGAELGYRWTGAEWSARLSATFADPENADTGATLLRRAKRKFAAEGDWQLSERWSLGGELVHVGRREDFGASLDRYTLLGVRLAYALSDAWQVQLRGENLTDEDYALAYGFNTPGRGAQLSLRYGD